MPTVKDILLKTFSKRVQSTDDETEKQTQMAKLDPKKECIEETDVDNSDDSDEASGSKAKPETICKERAKVKVTRVSVVNRTTKIRLEKLVLNSE